MESKLWDGLLQRERLSSAQVYKILKSAHSDGRVFLSEMHCGSSIDLVEATLQLPNRTKDFLWNFLHCFIFGCRPFYFCLANNLLFISFWGFFFPLYFLRQNFYQEKTGHRAVARGPAIFAEPSPRRFHIKLLCHFEVTRAREPQSSVTSSLWIWSSKFKFHH